MPQKIDEVADVVDPGLLGLALAQRMRSVAGSPIMELLKTTAKGDYISFASGLPDPALFPTARLAEIAEEVLTQDGRAALQYGPAEGYAPLRAWVADSLRQRGLVDATPEHVLITHGSQQALDLAARAFLDPEAPVLLESPSYLAAIQIFNSFQARYRTVEMDAEGIDADRAAATIREDRPRLVFTLPNYQNPTGITMSLTRRQRLADAAAQHGIPLLEDDAYFDLRYDGEPLPPITALAANPLAMMTGTFSKTMAPGLRVGYIYAAPPLIERLVQLKQITDLHTGTLAQRMVFRFCERGLLAPQIATLRETYSGRRDALLAALGQSMQGMATWTCPAGGMFLLVSLPTGLDAAVLLREAMARGVVFVPAAGFYPEGGVHHTLRLNFVSSGEAAIRQGVAILTEALTVIRRRS
jgi:2-aminoadipate transaminase